ncbi:uncharacterized protein FOMMEDRAFT_125041 [Fomitiporia mediterranea MF3/22]|uniref:uncharacterized protein n=1 Tax=Fomitiporia mediterranea (strain MF3/22) TaxID=694068 RepID=UPI0004408C5B|nr:uncharacterized protein FOMMEDRAFT_125041 [Fomitiporia mediterranea MF3/22]EJD02515.1 hypothetical protein FOMMEDRAFT_125041 [Fomitiporia mediterranea MF3/22]
MTSGSDRASTTPAPALPEDGEEPKPAAAPPKERRFKLSRACDRCRRRRIKCDEGHPCQSCIAARSACTFEEPGKRTHPKSKRAATLEDRMHHLESLIQSIPFSLFSAQAAAGAGLPNAQLPASMDPSSPHASLASANHAYPLGVPPPSLSLFPLMNPSTHFPTSNSNLTNVPIPQEPTTSGGAIPKALNSNIDPAMPPGYLYLDDEGYTRWQGESSGLPLLDFLVERKLPLSSGAHSDAAASPASESWSRKSENVTTGDWFPDRQPRQSSTANPETMWRLITSMIVPELMDNLVQCFLSTSYYLMPFLHVPTFLADYGNPAKWGEPGFASFIVAICCLSSRHIDDPRVRADPVDGFSAGAHWFDLFTKLRTVPTADRPTLYTVQSVFVAAVYAIGLGRLSRGFALLAEACTLSIDAGLHRSSEAYDCFGPIEEQVRRRTFWCVYLWDKQAGAAFGRPPVLRLKDCDAREPAAVDDEYITADSVGPQPEGTESRLGAFIACLRVSVVLEAVLDAPSPPQPSSSPFLQRASMLLQNPRAARRECEVEEQLLDDVLHNLPPFWAHTTETMGSADVLRVTQAERLHCLMLFVRMLITRSRFSWRVGERIRIANETSENGSGDSEGEQTEAERAAMMSCHTCAVELVHAHTQIAKKGLMTYYGVHVIHQLTQAGRSLIAVLLNCTTADLQPLVPASLEALRACVGLLRRFSGRYVCGLRSGELIEEFCRLTRIPLDAPQQPLPSQSQLIQSRPPWIRPVRKKTRSTTEKGGMSGESDTSRHGSPAAETTSPASASAVSPPGTQDTSGPSYQRLTGSSSVSATASFGRAGSNSHNENLLADLRGEGALGFTPNVGLKPNGLSPMNGITSIPGTVMDSMDGLGTMSPMDGITNVNLGSNMGMDGITGMGEMGGMDMSSSALITLLNDGSFDMATLFSGDLGMSAATPVSSNGDGGTSASASAMTGIVASP